MKLRATFNEGESDESYFQPETLSDWSVPMKQCLQRIYGWRVPPNWSVPEWFEEIGSVARLAAVEAAGTFDPARGTPFEAFVSSRVFARGLTFYRKEWAYATHHLETESLQPDNFFCSQCSFASSTSYLPACEALREILASLPEQDRWLIEELYVKERTQASIGRQLGISQRAVSKRKDAALSRLRTLLGQFVSNVRSHGISVTDSGGLPLCFQAPTPRQRKFKDQVLNGDSSRNKDNGEFGIETIAPRIEVGTGTGEQHH